MHAGSRTLHKNDSFEFRTMRYTDFELVKKSTGIGLVFAIGDTLS